MGHKGRHLSWNDEMHRLMVLEPPGIAVCCGQSVKTPELREDTHLISYLVADGRLLAGGEAAKVSRG